MSEKAPPHPWKHNTYPVQSWTDDDHPQNSRWFSQSAHDAPKIPKVIRAAKDSNVPRKGRTLVICLDGTGDSFDNDNSNVVHLVSCLKKDDPSQLAYYQSGIGTYSAKGLQGGLSAGIDMAIGSGLGVHVRDAYRFLMQNYREGDKICLFGFSRGSYTVRCLAGMLHKVGLLPAHNRAQVTFAYKFYKDDSEMGWKMSAEFKKTFCTNVNVYFVGVWDCVASVGFVPRKLPFSKSPTNAIGFFRHAMAMDEHRAKFKVCRWKRSADEDKNMPRNLITFDETPGAQTRSFFHHLFKRKPSSPSPSSAEKLKMNGVPNGTANGTVNGNANGKPFGGPRKTSTFNSLRRHSSLDQATLEAVFDKWDHHPVTKRISDVKEVWFMGAHADVGGGAVANEERHMLSRIPLRWMIRQCFECDTGILFSSAGLAEVGLDVDSLWPVYKERRKPVVGPSPRTMEVWEKGMLPPLRRRSSALGISEKKIHARDLRIEETYHDDSVLMEHRFGREEGGDAMGHDVSMSLLPEQVEDFFDAKAGINDQLIQAKFWWILEFWPIKVRVQRKEERKEGEEGKDGDEWVKKVRCNLGRYRVAQEGEPLMHWTVEMRVGDGEYRNRVKCDRHSVWRAVC